MKFRLIRLARASALLLLAPSAFAACPPASHDRDALVALKLSGFVVDDDAKRQQLAHELVACLSDPDPLLRDGIAYEGLTTWLRGERLDTATRQQLLDRLIEDLHRDDDASGFVRPFAALALSEVVRTDRITPWLDDEQRTALIPLATEYLESVRDYRGFDPSQGWRHGVAHGADFALQLIVNPAVDKAGVQRLLAAIGSQVQANGLHAYTEREAERLARPVLFAAQRDLLSDEEWSAWFQSVASPAPMANWSEAYQSRAGLNRRHNLAAFLFAAYVGARESGDERFEVLLPMLREAIKQLP